MVAVEGKINTEVAKLKYAARVARERAGQVAEPGTVSFQMAVDAEFAATRNRQNQRRGTSEFSNL